MNGIGRSPQVAASVLICGLLLGGCDDRVTVIRDSNIPIPKGSTWAWKPVAPPKDADRRPVVSRDVISRGETVAREPGANNEIVRQRIRTAIEQTLSSKGLRQVSDPRDAEFLVDYHVAVRRHDVTVQRGYRADTRASFVALMDAGNRGAGGRRKSATKMFASAKARWSLTL
jgi:hypothetical protein